MHTHTGAYSVHTHTGIGVNHTHILHIYTHIICIYIHYIVIIHTNIYTYRHATHPYTIHVRTNTNVYM